MILLLYRDFNCIVTLMLNTNISNDNHVKIRIKFCFGKSALATLYCIILINALNIINNFIL